MHDVFPTLKTDNLLLRQIVDADISSIYEGLSHPEVVKYYGVSFSSLLATQEQMKWFKELEEHKTGIWWAITDLANKKFYGAIGFNNHDQMHRKAEIGFWLLPMYWGNGIMKKAIDLVCSYAFNSLKIHRIEALVETGNENSKRILNKSEFKYEGTLVDFEIKNGNFINLDSYAKFHPLK
jgi:ribosomal-protein-alanine N-acetyltransferase